MLAKLSCVFVLLFVAQIICTATSSSIEDRAGLDEYNSVYYNPKTGGNLKPILEGTDSLKTQISYRGLSCGCKGFACSCCAGIKISAIKFKHDVCIKLGIENSAIRLSLNVDEKQIAGTSVSLDNLPPLCIKVPKINLLKLCIHIYNVRVEGKSLQGCVDLQTRVSGKPVLVLHFSCLTINVRALPSEIMRNGTYLEHLKINEMIEEPGDLSEIEPQDFEFDFEPQDYEVDTSDAQILSPGEEEEAGQLQL